MALEIGPMGARGSYPGAENRLWGKAGHLPHLVPMLIMIYLRGLLRFYDVLLEYRTRFHSQ